MSNLILNEDTFARTAKVLFKINPSIKEWFSSAKKFEQHMINTAYTYMNDVSVFETYGYVLSAYPSDEGRGCKASVSVSTIERYLNK